eukprot:c17184_g1_i1.p1 GENE.c17184_g1_i1~~c17184_g1_i1.p1  ORF type:complete len:169 (-),score=30.64 c17184_g1_i1:130-636(-)
MRLTGGVDDVECLRSYCDSLGPSLMVLPSKEDHRTVTSLLKLWVNRLPQPLVPDSTLDELCAAKRVEEMRDILSTLPEVNFLVLKHFFAFLKIVAAHQPTNKMDVYNLARVLAPTILRTDAITSLTHLNHHVDCLVRMMKHFDGVFGPYEAPSNMTHLPALTLLTPLS